MKPEDFEDLGVIMSVDCIFNQQISSIVQRAKNQVSWILRPFEKGKEKHF